MTDPSKARLRRITLRYSRHTTLPLMEHAGVPISIVSKWAGHYDSGFTQKTFMQAMTTCSAASSVGQDHKIVWACEQV